MNNLSLTQLFVILRARWLSFALVGLAVVALAAGGSLLMAKKYTATAAVVLDVKSPDPIAGVVLPGMTVVGYMGTQVGVLQSERVALRAIDKLGLEADPQWREQWVAQTEGAGSFKSWISDALLAKLESVPARDSNVISLSYTAKSPEFAAKVANAFVDAYIETTLELRTEPAKQYNSMFDDRSVQLRGQLEKAQGKLAAYQQSNGILVTDERLDVENSRLSELTAQLVALQAVAVESGSRQNQSESTPEQMQEVLTNPLVVPLSADLARQQASLSEMIQRLGESNPQVQQLRANIAELESRLKATVKRVTGSVALNNTVNQSRVAQLRASIDQQRTKLLQMRGQRDEALVLSRDVDNAQRAFDAVVARRSESGLESQATQTNVSVLKRASPPPRPSSPRMTLNMAIAVLVGVLLGIATAMVRELRDHRLRTEEDVLRVLHQPLFGVLPNRPSGLSRSQSRRESIQRRLLAILPQPVRS